MELMLFLLGIAVLGTFLLGVGAAIWLLVKLLGKLFSPPKPGAAAKPPAHTLAVPPSAAQPAKPPAAPAALPRAELLQALRSEMNRGFNRGRISGGAYAELRKYLQNESDLAGPHPGPEALPPAEPAPPSKVEPEAQPLLDLLEKLTPPMAAAAAAKPEADARPMRAPEEIRAAIAKLHADAQAPVVPEPVHGRGTPVPPAKAGTAAASAREPLTPSVPLVSGGERQRVSPPPALQKSLSERLATPENVRILQSLGIGLVFISAVALVRTQWWNMASPWAQMGILLAGTAACSGIGFALRRWTQLRITGLVFLILGQLSLLLDAYAALITPGGTGIYPYSAASLWTISFAIFAATAFWEARALNETLFEAFAFFGGVAAWGSAALWFGVDEWLLPAAFVPVALICAKLSRLVGPAALAQASSLEEKAAETAAPPGVPRWSLPWWLAAGWTMGSGLLAVVLPVAAIVSGQERLAGQYWPHTCAILALTAGMLVAAWRTGRVASAQGAAVLLMMPAPLAAYAFAWPWAEWSVAFALPGAALVLLGLLYARFAEQTTPAAVSVESGAPLVARETTHLGEAFAYWGMAGTLLGVGWSFCAEYYAPVPAFSAWAALGGLVVGLAFALLQRTAWGPWLATLCAAFLITLCVDQTAWWPAAWLALAVAAYAAWTFAGQDDDVRSHGCLTADALTMFAVTYALSAEFWLASCRADVREACVIFFAATLLVSLLCGLGLKRAFAPVAGILALLGLAGCAYGAWQPPEESFGLCCALLAWLACGVGELARKAAAWARTKTAGAAHVAGVGVAILGAVYLLCGLVDWGGGDGQSWAVAAWLLLAAWAWVVSARAAASWKLPVATAFALAAGLCVSGAACHAMRWMNLHGEEFGPGLAATALLLLALREVAAWIGGLATEEEADQEMSAASAAAGLALDHRLRGVLAAIFLTAAASLCFGAVAALNSHAWLWCLTLVQTALLGMALTVVARRAGRTRGAILFLLELSVWVFLALAIEAATSFGALNLPLPNAAWILVAALFLLVGMALESIVSGLSPAAGGTASVPFLASRHVAAFGLTALALLDTMFEGHAFSRSGLQLTWRALFSAAALAVYGSFARTSASETATQAVRKCSAFMAYVVLLPAGYLCLLGAHSTGSSWGALYFLALVPVLFAAAYVMEREKLAVQSLHALLGAGLVSVGALVLAFAGNRARLPEVPCATFFALALELLLLRAWCPLKEDIERRIAGRQYTVGVCLVLIGAAAYGLRALAGWPAWGAPEPWAWQMPWLAVLGLVMTALGGALRLECLPRSPAFSPEEPGDRGGQSVVAYCGAWLPAVAAALSLVFLLYHGTRAHYLCWPNTDYLDAAIASLVLCAGTALAAGRWLDLAASRYLATACLLGGYALCVWKQHPEAWEWYSLPAALFLFVWAWETARGALPAPALPALEEERRRQVNVFLTLASALALLPSFLQAMPDSTDGTRHFLLLLGLSLAVVFGAMCARRKVPLLAGSGALLLVTLIKAVQWAHHKEVLGPIAGIAFGCAVLAVGMLFEQRMNQAFRKTVDKARAEARMFWVSWQ